LEKHHKIKRLWELGEMLIFVMANTSDFRPRTYGPDRGREEMLWDFTEGKSP
jgi:hypothetical protein